MPNRVLIRELLKCRRKYLKEKKQEVSEREKNDRYIEQLLREVDKNLTVTVKDTYGHIRTIKKVELVTGKDAYRYFTEIRITLSSLV